MKMPPFAYHRPSSVDDAITLLHQFDGDAKVLAGGQSLLPVMAIRLGAPANLVDIARIKGHDQILVSDGLLEIGCRVTHAEVETSAVVAEAVPLLTAAMPYVGHRAIRNRGTICGSLAHADPSAELPAVALALGAVFVARSTAGTREIEAIDFFTGFLSTDLADDELLVAVRFPVLPSNAGVSLRELSRRHGDFALVGIVAAIIVDNENRIEDASLVFFGVGSKPTRAVGAEQALIGQPATAASFEMVAQLVSLELDPMTDGHASGAYRAHTAGVLTRDALAEAAHTIGASK